MQIVASLTSNPDILPQEHFKNAVVEIVFDQFVEILCRCAFTDGGPLSKDVLKLDGCWAMLEHYLLDHVFPGYFPLASTKFLFQNEYTDKNQYWKAEYARIKKELHQSD